jgi:hypothetical protein
MPHPFANESRFRIDLPPQRVFLFVEPGEQKLPLSLGRLLRGRIVGTKAVRYHQIERIGYGVLDSDEVPVARISVLGPRITIRRAGPVRVPHSAVDRRAVAIELPRLGVALPHERRVSRKARPALIEDVLELQLGIHIEERLLQRSLGGDAPPPEIVEPRPIVSPIDVVEGGLDPTLTVSA